MFSTPSTAIESKMEFLLEVFGPMDRYRDIQESYLKSVLKRPTEDYERLRTAVNQFHQAVSEKLNISSESKNLMEMIYENWPQGLADLFLESLKKQEVLIQNIRWEYESWLWYLCVCLGIATHILVPL